MARLPLATALLGAAALLLSLAFLARPDRVEEQVFNSRVASPNSGSVDLLPREDESAVPPTSESNRPYVDDTQTDSSEPPVNDAAVTDASSRSRSEDSTNIAAQANGDRGEPRLSQHVMSVLMEVQRRQQAEQWEEALNELNALYRQYDELSSFEQSTLLNFYTNTLLSLQMWNEAISAFSLMLTIPDLGADVNARATLALGQLHGQIGDAETAAAYYRTWLNDPTVPNRTQERAERVRNLLREAEEGNSN